MGLLVLQIFTSLYVNMKLHALSGQVLIHVLRSGIKDSRCLHIHNNSKDEWPAIPVVRACTCICLFLCVCVCVLVVRRRIPFMSHRCPWQNTYHSDSAPAQAQHAALACTISGVAYDTAAACPQTSQVKAHARFQV